jgi:cytidine deaminase
MPTPDVASGVTDELIQAARSALDAAYVPYSEYTVGAALRTADGTVFTGCNIENANYSNSLHAEEVAIAEAVKNGHREFDCLAVSSGARDGVTPCGMCRQTLAEFCADDLPVVCDEGGESTTTYTLGELLPETIGPGTLESAERSRNTK